MDSRYGGLHKRMTLPWGTKNSDSPTVCTAQTVELFHKKVGKQRMNLFSDCV